jgi:hypothetical protein
VEEMRQKQEAEEEEQQTVIWTNKIKFFASGK